MSGACKQCAGADVIWAPASASGPQGKPWHTPLVNNAATWGSDLVLILVVLALGMLLQAL